MRTTLNLDDDLLQRASRLTGIRQKTALLHAGMEALNAIISPESVSAGSTSTFSPPPRSRARPSGRSTARWRLRPRSSDCRDPSSTHPPAPHARHHLLALAVERAALLRTRIPALTF